MSPIRLTAKFPTIRPAVVGKLNERQVLRLLQRRGLLSRAEVARQSGLSAPTVSKAVGSLLRSGLLEEVDAAELARGRPAPKLRLATASAQVLGIAIDAGHCEVVAAGLTHRLNDVTYAGGMFVAVGGTSVTNGNATGFIHTSSNGVTWSQRTVVSNSELLGAGYGNGLFVALGMNATVMTSTNGITWVRRFTGLYGETARLAFGNGRFAAVRGGLHVGHRLFHEAQAAGRPGRHQAHTA
jgi:hypothetical protein